MLKNLISIVKTEAMKQEKSGTNWSEIQRIVKSFADQIIQIQLNRCKSLAYATPVTSKPKADDKLLGNLLLPEYGVTLENIFMMQVIEKVKELLVYTEQSLKQIAITLGYNNPSILSNLLKKYSGFTSTYFKQIRKRKLEIIRRQQTEQP